MPGALRGLPVGPPAGVPAEPGSVEEEVPRRPRQPPDDRHAWERKGTFGGITRAAQLRQTPRVAEPPGSQGSEAVLRGRARATSLLLLSIPWKGSCLPSVHRPGPVRARDAAAPQHRLRQGPQAPSPSTWPADAQRLFGKRHQSSGKEPARQRSRGSGPGPRQGSAGSR